MENVNEIPQEVLSDPRFLEFLEIANKITEIRDQQLFKSLELLGYTFTSQNEAEKFFVERLVTLDWEDRPGVKMLYLDYGKPTEVKLGEYNDNPQLVDGKMAFCDEYYAGPTVNPQDN